MPETTTDDALLAQLRAWADDLGAQVGAVTAPTADLAVRRAGRPPATRTVALATAVLVVLVVLGVAAAIVVRGGPEEEVRTAPTTTVAPEPDVPLLGTTWWLDRLTVDDEDVPVPPEANPSVHVGPCDPDADCAGSTAVTGSDGCNRFSGDVEVRPDALVVGQVTSTQAGCSGDRGAASEQIWAVLRDEVAYEVDGRTLTLSREGVEATYVAGDATFPPIPDGATVLAEGTDPEHRAAWREVEGDDGPAVELQLVVRRGFSLWEGSAVLDADARGEGEMGAVALGTRPAVVAGLVDGRATQVVFEAHQGTPTPVPTVPVAGHPGVRVFVVAVPAAAGPWTAVATDADGEVVATDTWEG